MTQATATAVGRPRAAQNGQSMRTVWQTVRMAEEKKNKVIVKALLTTNGTTFASDNEFDAVAVELEDKHLKVIGARGQVVAIYAPGCWADVYVS